jgi:hypothetical protein
VIIKRKSQDGKTVHKVDNWHLRQQSSMSESNSSLLHKSIFIKVLSSLSEILRVSFSPPTLAQIRECTFFLGHIYSSHPNPHLFINGIASIVISPRQDPLTKSYLEDYPVSCFFSPLLVLAFMDCASSTVVSNRRYGACVGIVSRSARTSSSSSGVACSPRVSPWCSAQ